MTIGDFSAEEKASLVRRIQIYFETELDYDLGQFEAEFLLDFLSRTVGPYYFNQGLLEARRYLRRRMDDLDEKLEELEVFYEGPR